MIYLASTSPRRKKILTEAGIRYRTLQPVYREITLRGYSPRRLVRAHALGKALSAAALIKNGRVLAADTLVFFQGKLIGKPRDLREAFRVLGRLQGNWHEVYTGVAILWVMHSAVKRRRVFVEKTRVKITPMDAAAIRAYFRKINPLDKAGAYAIQSKHSIVEAVRGLKSNAVGLPIERIQKDLRP